MTFTVAYLSLAMLLWLFYFSLEFITASYLSHWQVCCQLLMVYHWYMQSAIYRWLSSAFETRAINKVGYTVIYHCEYSQWAVCPFESFVERFLCMHLNLNHNLILSKYQLFLSMANYLAGDELVLREVCENRLFQLFAKKGKGFCERRVIMTHMVFKVFSLMQK